VAEAAAGVLEVADAIMARGVRVVSVNRGHDPRDFHLVPFGGAGPMHALNVGSMVDVGGVVVPVNPGTFSAVGLAASDVKYDFIQLVDLDAAEVDVDELETSYAGLIAAAATRLEVVGSASQHYTRIARFRYAWQDNDVEVVVGEKPVDPETLRTAIAGFHRKHQFEFGHSDESERVELVSIGIEAVGVLERAEQVVPDVPVAHDATPASHRPVYFTGPGWTDAPVYERAQLAPGARFSGPSVVEEREATTVVIPGVTGVVDRDGNLVLSYPPKGDPR
jgi:N-methylhydantoinase A